MFEKEAEDKAFEKYPVPTKGESIALERNLKYEEGFKDGAESGYNKGYHDAEEHYLNVIDNQHKLVDESKKKDFRKCMKCTDGTYQSGFKDGYNKAKIEVEESYRESLCNSELNLARVTEELEELDKANEWHYPSRGELPECDEKTRLIFYVTCYYGDITRKRLVLGYYQKSFINDDIKLFTEKSKGYEEEHLPKDVIAWKVVELPEEIE